MELHKAFKGPELERYVQPFLEFVRTMYVDFQAIIHHHFPEIPPPEQRKELMTSRMSFKVWQGLVWVWTAASNELQDPS